MSNETYNKFDSARRLPSVSISYLKKNAPVVWKILKYSTNPYGQDDLTTAQINSLIMSQWSSDAVNKYAVLPIRFSGQALSGQQLQLRVSLWSGDTINPLTARVRILLQFICANDACVISTPYSVAEDRAFALMQESIKVLVGADLPGIGTVLNMNGTQDRNVGWQAVKFNDNYCGYECVLSCLTQQ